MAVQRTESVSVNMSDSETVIVPSNSNGHNQELRISKKSMNREKKGKEIKDRLQCEFIIPRKNRRCPMTRKVDVLYCAQHLKESSNEKRIQCPIDPRHSIWEKDLKTHVKKCEAKQAQIQEVPWFKLNHNCDAALKPTVTDENFQPEYPKWVKIVDEIFNDNFKPLELIQLNHEGTKGRMEELQNQKHILQQSSLISHLDSREMLSSDLNYIEFGCGRAELSRYFLKSILYKDHKPSDFILIDRSPTRLKLDSKMIKDVEEANLPANKVYRVKIDIKDLNIDQIISDEFQKDKKFVAISKHLCGAATDLTLQCILNSKCLNEEGRFKGMIVAMCCRHCCDYTKLTEDSKNYLSNLGIDELGFKHLMKFASWAVNGRRPGMEDADGADHLSGLNIKQREDLGLKARRIIDESRKFALEQSVLDVKVELCKYVSSDISLENTALIVTRK